VHHRRLYQYPVEEELWIAPRPPRPRSHLNYESDVSGLNRNERGPLLVASPWNAATLVITRKGRKVVTIPPGPRTGQVNASMRIICAPYRAGLDRRPDHLPVAGAPGSDPGWPGLAARHPYVLYGLQLANGVHLQAFPRDLSAVDNQGVLSIVFFLFAIARAWQLVGARDTGLLSTVAGMAQRQVSQGTHHAEDDQDPPGGQDEAD
jgi:hypothetical protein